MTDDLSSYIDDIINSLDDSSEKEVSREELEKELKKFVEYGVPLEHAKHTLIKKYGGQYVASSSERMMISDIESEKSSVNVVGRIVHVSSKDITVKGENRNIFYGIIGDESGSISFTAWRDFDFVKDDVVDISNAYSREWQGEVKLNFGDRTKIKKIDSDINVVSLDPKEFKIKDLRSGLGSVEVVGRILELNKRDVEVNGEKKKVFSGVIGDETGKAQFTSWHDFKFKNGDVVKIVGGYVKSWKGIPQLTFDDKASVSQVKSSDIPKKDLPPQKLMMYELAEKRGAMDVCVEGTVLEIRSGSGFIMRCPSCNRSLINSVCSVHGEVEGVQDLRIKLVVDDGTGVVSCIVDKDSTVKLLGKSYDELKKINDSKGSDSIVEMINDVLFASKLSLRGNALGDSFGITVIAKDIEVVDVDVELESSRLTEDLEGLL